MERYSASANCGIRAISFDISHQEKMKMFEEKSGVR
jgi:hypothetical protein